MGNGGNDIFMEMSSNIPGNVAKHSGKCRQTFRGMSPMFGVNEENYWAELHLESCQTSMMELFCENSTTADVRLDSNEPPIACAVNVGCRWTAST